MPYTLENIHPLFIHFPIALLFSGLLFDLISEFINSIELKNTGFHCMVLGIISSFVSNLTGLFAFLAGQNLIDIFKFNHAILAWIQTLLFIVLLWIRISFDIDLKYSIFKKNVYYIIYVIAVSILFYSAHLGAKAAGRI